MAKSSQFKTFWKAPENKQQGEEINVPTLGQSQLGGVHGLDLQRTFLANQDTQSAVPSFIHSLIHTPLQF